MTKRILITGGAGFLGFQLAKKMLSEGYIVCLTDNLARGVHDDDFKLLLDNPNASFIETNLLEPNLSAVLGKNYSEIFHLAAIIGVAHVVGQPLRVLSENVKMLENVLELAFDQKNLNRFLFASTSEVYAGTLDEFSLTVPTPELSPLTVSKLVRPRTSYMLSKIYGEAMCMHAGIPFTIFRPHNIYGPRMGMSHVIPELLLKAWIARPGDSIPVNSIDHKRAFCFIDDAVEMLFRMFQLDSCVEETVNLGKQDPESRIDEVARMCFEVVGKDLVIQPIGATEGSPIRRAPDMRKLAGLIDCKAHIELAEGIHKTWQWYKPRLESGKETIAQ